MSIHAVAQSLPDLFRLVTKPYSAESIREGVDLIHPVTASDSIRKSLYGPHRTESWSDYANAANSKFLTYLKQIRQQYCPVPYLSPGEHYPGRDYFVMTDTFKDLTSRLVPAPSVGDSSSNYVIVGPRGSGKTLTQNCWIHEHHDELDRHQIFWVRCDAPKLYDLWKSGTIVASDANFPSLDEYLDIQLLYVFAKNLERGKPFFLEAFDLIDRAEMFESATFLAKKGAQKNLREFIAETGSLILKDESGKPRTYSTAVDTILRVPGVAATQKRIWQSASERLQHVLDKNGYSILRVLDGIDNVDCQNAAMLKWYRKLVSEAAEFIYHSDPHGRRGMKLMTARNATWSDIVAIGHSQRDRLPDVDPIVLRHSAPRFSRVMQKRAIVIREKSPPPADSGVTWSNDDKKAIVSLAGDKLFMVADSGDRNDLNLKAWIRNRLNLIGHLYYRSLQTGQDTEKISYAQRPESRRYLFLNDRFFLDSHTNRRSGRVEVGFVFPNPFYLGEPEVWNGTQLSWDGLMAIRILQAVSALGNHRGVAWRKVIACLSALFGYDRNRLERTLDILRDHSLVETESDRGYVAHTYESLDDLTWREGLKLKSNRFGHNFLGIVFSNPDCLYFMALDTFLPARILDMGFILSHHNGFSESSGNPTATRFASAAVVTSVAFLRFVLDVERQELARAAAVLGANQDGCCKGLDIGCFRLPIHNHHMWKKFLRGCESLYYSANDSEQKFILGKLDALQSA